MRKLDARELRFGNWVNKIYSPTHNVNIQATFKDISDLFIKSSIDLLPIKLTPEILEKSGFKIFTPNYNILPTSYSLDVKRFEKWYTQISIAECNDKGLGEFYLFLKQGQDDNNPGQDDIISLTSELLYVHELQNYYFLLSKGKELDIKF